MAKAAGRHHGQQAPPSARRVAVKVLLQVLEHAHSLSTARARVFAELSDTRDKALAMELVHGVLRWRWKLEAIIRSLLNKPLRRKDHDIQILLMMSLYQLMELNTPDYAVVDEAVQLSRQLKKSWSSAMVNGVLRTFLRDRATLLSTIDNDEVAHFAHPEWLIKAIRDDWPQHWRQILQANNQRPPLWLRVNRKQHRTDEYIALLQQAGLPSQPHPHASEALKLDQGMDVQALPGFAEGAVSVQDVGAQLAAGLLQAESGQRVLDLCAAPGGKTCHLLETATDIEMIAVDVEPQRMQRVEENLERLQLRAELIVGDAIDTASWWDGRCFDRILIDAPCSATGVIRRHPDIKSLRRAEDLQALTQSQQKILTQAWQMLSPGGHLLYVTCSVLRQENEQQIKQLLAELDDASEIRFDADWGVACEYGRQLLPGEGDADGFYFTCLNKA